MQNKSFVFKNENSVDVLPVVFLAEQPFEIGDNGGFQLSGIPLQVLKDRFHRILLLCIQKKGCREQTQQQSNEVP